MGKWSKLVQQLKLPKFFKDEDTTKERIGQIIKALKTNSLEELPEKYHEPVGLLLGVDNDLNSLGFLAELFTQARHNHNIAVQEERCADLAKRAVSILLEEKFEMENSTSIGIDGFTVSCNPEPYIQIEDKEEFRLWCIENGLEKSLGLAWQTANSIMKVRLEDGEAEPDGTIAYFVNRVAARKKDS